MSVGCTTAGHRNNGIVLQWDADPKWASIMLAPGSLHIAWRVTLKSVCSRSWAENVIC